MSIRSLAAALALASTTGMAAAESAPALDRTRTALVFIEFQHEWIGENGRLRKLLVRDDAALEQATAAAARVLSQARASGWNIAHAPLDMSADPGYLLFGGGRDRLGLAAAIPAAGTWQASGVGFVAPFVPVPGEFVSRGRSGASVIANSTLDPYLRNNGIDTLVLMGFATHVCVESTLRQAHDMGYRVLVVTDATASFEAEQQAYFEDHVLHHFGAGITSDELISRMRAQAGE